MTVKVRDDYTAIKVDVADAATIYVGAAQTGSNTDQPVWQIKKISISGSIIHIYFADGDQQYDNVWNNRTSLSYS